MRPLLLLLALVPHIYAARRSHSTRLSRRQGLLGQLVPGILGPDSSPTTSILDPVTIFPSSSSSSSSSSSTPTPTPTSTTPDGGLLGGLVSGVGSVVNTLGSDLGGAVSTVGSDLGGIIGGAPSSTPTASPTDPTSPPPSPADPTSAPAAPSSDGGLLGGLTSVVGGVVSGVGDVVSTIGSDVGGVLNPPGPSTTAPPPSNTPPGSPGPPQTQPPAPASSSDGGLLDGVTSVVGGVVSDVGGAVSTIGSDVGGVLNPPGPSTTAPAPAPSNTPPGSPSPQPSSSSDGGLLDGVTSVVGGLTSDVGGVISTVTSGLGGVVGTPTSDPVSTTVNSNPGSSTSSSGGIIDTLTSDLGGVIPTSISTTGSVTEGPNGGVNATSSTSSGAVEPTDTSPNITSSAQPTISFPTQTTNVSTPTTTVSINQTSTEFVTTVITTTSTTISVASELSFVLDESTLAFASLPTSIPSVTFTDPDQATTSVDPLAAQPVTTLVAPPLPSGIPGWIYPRQRLDPNSSDLEGFTLISILFNKELNWMFEIQDPISSSQIFVYMPMLINTALGISADQVKTFALRVFVPDTYRSPSDAAQLGTLYLGYIPNNMIDPLAAQIKVKSSAFYTRGPDSNSRALAQRVVPSYSLLSVSPEGDPGSGGPSDNSGNNNGSSDSSRTREEAIIGVVSALGSIALLVLGFLVYRSYKRRQQLAHRRLSDPPGENLGVRPQGREFDQDSVGGARRRSFYYAEDSLRGYESQPAPNDQLMAESSMNQRRNVVPGSISAPVLRGSTMNW